MPYSGNTSDYWVQYHGTVLPYPMFHCLRKILHKMVGTLRKSRKPIRDTKTTIKKFI